MKRFDRKFLSLLRTAKIELALYKRYVDDIMSALAGLDPEVRWENGKMILKPERVEEDRTVSADKRTLMN